MFDFFAAFILFYENVIFDLSYVIRFRECRNQVFSVHEFSVGIT